MRQSCSRWTVPVYDRRFFPSLLQGIAFCLFFTTDIPCPCLTRKATAFQYSWSARFPPPLLPPATRDLSSFLSDQLTMTFFLFWLHWSYGFRGNALMRAFFFGNPLFFFLRRPFSSPFGGRLWSSRSIGRTPLPRHEAPSRFVPSEAVHVPLFGRLETA